MTQAYTLMQGLDPDYVLADKAFDAEGFLAFIAAIQAEAVIPPRNNRKQPREYDTELYKERHLIECFIGKLKYFRRVFSRFDKLARNYLAFVHFASALICLR